MKILTLSQWHTYTTYFLRQLQFIQYPCLWPRHIGAQSCYQCEISTSVLWHSYNFLIVCNKHITLAVRSQDGVSEPVAIWRSFFSRIRSRLLTVCTWHWLLIARMKYKSSSNSTQLHSSFFSCNITSYSSLDQMVHFENGSNSAQPCHRSQVLAAWTLQLSLDHKTHSKNSSASKVARYSGTDIHSWMLLDAFNAHLWTVGWRLSTAGIWRSQLQLIWCSLSLDYQCTPCCTQGDVVTAWSITNSVGRHLALVVFSSFYILVWGISVVHSYYRQRC